MTALALLGSSSAIKLNTGFIDGDFDDNDFFAANDQGVDNYDKAMMKKDQAHVATKADIKMKSDPIFGSLGPDVLPKHKMTAEEKFEADLNSRTPMEFTDDKEQHLDTVDSIAWAEKQVGAELTLPKKKSEETLAREAVDPDSIDYDDDHEVESTLESAH